MGVDQIALIVAIVSSLAAAAAGIGALWQAYLLRFSLKVQALFLLDQRFNDPAFRKIRAGAARLLQAGVRPEQPGGDIDEVLDFLDTVGLLVKRRTLDKEMVWHTFFYWVHGYCGAAHHYIDDERHKNPLVWNYLSGLYDTVVALENKKGKGLGVLSQETVSTFLNGEARL